MKKIFILFAILTTPFIAFASDTEICDGALKITLNDDKETDFCQVERFLVSKTCAENPKRCKLISDLKTKLPGARKKESLAPSDAVRNPGSKICEILGWKESMGEMWDESEVCVCQHPKGGFVTCSSLI